MLLSATYKNAEGTLVDLDIAEHEPADTPFDYQATEFSIENLDLTINVYWAALVREKIADGSLVPAPYVAPPPPVPESISDRQFFQQLAIAGIITNAEALSAVKTGDIPAALATIVVNMPLDQQFNAEMILSGATVFYRSHPMTAAIGAAYGWSSEQIDDFFRAATLL